MILLTSIQWTDEHEKLFQSIKDRISEDTTLAVPSTDYPFHSHVDSWNVGTGCIIFNSFRKENGSFPSFLGSSMKLSRNCLLVTENSVGLSPQYKPMNTTLVLSFRSIFNVSIKLSSTYGDANDSCPIKFLVIEFSS